MNRRITTTRIGTVALCLVSFAAMPAAQDGEKAAPPAEAKPAARPDDAARSLEETRLSMGKWIETQQILSRERKDWQQGKEILQGRLELVKQEIASLEEKIQEAQSSVATADQKHAELVAENERLKAAGAQLTDAAVRLESEIRRIAKRLPEPVRTKLQPLFQRMPEDASKVRVTTAERFQNVLGILNALATANTEISVQFEVHELAGGKPTEVKTIYVGLAQAYYVSGGGEAGIGRPPPSEDASADGWIWEPANAIAGDVLKAVEILEGKQSPAFVPLPLQIR
jgi:hypothetical protein